MPGPSGKEELLNVHIHKTRLLKPLLILGRNRPRPTCLIARLDYQLLPPHKWTIFRGMGVREEKGKYGVLVFQDAAGGEGIVGGADDEQRVFEAGYYGAAVNVREGLVEKPFVFRVVDFEGAVGWHVQGLDGGDVRP